MQQLKAEWPDKEFKLSGSSEKLKTLLQLEHVVTQYIQDICTKLSHDDHKAAATVKMIHIQGPVHIPSDFTIIKLPTLDSSTPVHKEHATTTLDSSISSMLLYVTAQRPITTQLVPLLSHTSERYSIHAPIPIAIAYYRDFSADKSTPIEQVDMQSVQQAIRNAVEHMLHATQSTQCDHAKLTACVSNTVLVDRAAIGTFNDRAGCNRMFEQVRYATTCDALSQWRILLERACVRANGFKAITSSLTANSSNSAKQACTIALHTLRVAAGTYHTGMFEAIQQQLTAMQNSSNDYATSTDGLTNWIDITCKQLLQDYGRFAAAMFSKAITDTITGLSSDAYDTILRYLTEFAASHVS
jgi:hypothetical protein